MSYKTLLLAAAYSLSSCEFTAGEPTDATDNVIIVHVQPAKNEEPKYDAQFLHTKTFFKELYKRYTHLMEQPLEKIVESVGAVTKIDKQTKKERYKALLAEGYSKKDTRIRTQMIGIEEKICVLNNKQKKRYLSNKFDDLWGELSDQGKKLLKDKTCPNQTHDYNVCCDYSVCKEPICIIDLH